MMRWEWGMVVRVVVVGVVVGVVVLVVAVGRRG
jgi:hypothetical protein